MLQSPLPELGRRSARLVRLVDSHHIFLVTAGAGYSYGAQMTAS